MDTEQRIQQFSKMVESDPDNELGHFSLGKALAEAGRFAEAQAPLQRVLQLNQDYSRAYQDLAAVQLKLEQREAAVATLRKGIVVADGRGDLMPRDAMARMLTDLGETAPTLAAAPAAHAVAAGADFNCARCGRPAERMEKAPFKGELGERVHNHVCEPCWREWIGVGTKVINEMGLVLANPQAQQVYDEHMVEFLQLDR
ncbi:MAG: Fe(2+)-trafficking protein [Planctomycetota bacterium]|jgi:Fe-S cluster biosynthesis and repair protein YggX